MGLAPFPQQIADYDELSADINTSEVVKRSGQLPIEIIFIKKTEQKICIFPFLVTYCSEKGVDRNVLNKILIYEEVLKSSQISIS